MISQIYEHKHTLSHEHLQQTRLASFKIHKVTIYRHLTIDGNVAAYHLKISVKSEI
jgi:hypothetical protein